MSNTALTISLEDLQELINSSAAADPAVYQYYRMLGNRCIIVNEEIGEGLIEKVILPLMEMDNDGTGEPIELILNTVGGVIYDGMMLCRVIENLKTPTTIRILSMAASMGALIAMAGHNNPNVKTVCYKYSVFLIHAGSYYFEGSAMQVKDSFRFQEHYETIISDYVLSHSTITEDEYKNKTRYEWWMTASDAFDYGIVDEVL